jgi:23S rRNA (cytosine1962-C5)-methyltransferase
MKKLVIKSAGAARLRRGYPWVFSNEACVPLSDFEGGEIVEVEDGHGTFLGTAYVNPHSLILARVLSRKREPIDAGFFRDRIARSLAWRERLYPEGAAYRLVFAEGDGLPGLVVDRYGDILVVQAQTLGIDRRLETITGVLEDLIHPRALVERDDRPVRALEGLPPRRGILRGALEGPVSIEEGGVQFEVDVLEGQKTGFYLDHRESRAAFARLAARGEVLDVFAYTGAWALEAARAGAARVTLVESSAKALALAHRNAERNALADRCEILQGDAFEAIRNLDRAGRRFDAVVVDPPAFVKSKRRLAEGLGGYRDLNARAVALVREGGLLASSSCSYHVDWGLFEAALADAMGRAGRRATVLYRGGQPPDHPVPLLLPEAAYLKCLILRIEAGAVPGASRRRGRRPADPGPGPDGPTIGGSSPAPGEPSSLTVAGADDSLFGGSSWPSRHFQVRSSAPSG